MTEEIIIDGVNVAGCEYYKGKCMEYTHYCQIGCKECTDIGTKLCHYKQTERFKAKIDRLEQENKELEKKLELDEVQLNSYFIGEEKICKENEKYRKALEDIRNRISNIHYRPVAKMKEIEELINGVLGNEM